MYDYGFFSYESKDDFLDRSRAFWNPDKTDFWQDAGVDLVIDRREGYFLGMAGRRLVDLHLNGGTYNLGHRNPELIATLEQAMRASTSATTTSRRWRGPRWPRLSSRRARRTCAV